MKVYIFLADGFEEIEAIAPIDIFRRAGFNTTTVSVKDTTLVTAAHQLTVQADVTFDTQDFSDADLLFLPGGMPGTLNLDAHTGLKQIITKQLDANKDVAAICAAPSILGQMGLLQNREAICYPGFEPKLTNAHISDKPVVMTDRIHTAQGAGVAVDFALALVARFTNQATANKLAETLCKH